jgi:hypothetical protein
LGGDETTPWWFPSKTDAGSIGEDRIVLPIPMGMRWRGELPRILPAEGGQLSDFDERRRVVVSGQKERVLPKATHGQDARGTKAPALRSPESEFGRINCIDKEWKAESIAIRSN